MTSPVVPSAGVAPGWYSDPWQQAALRWWDGAQWTEHVSAWSAPVGMQPNATQGLEYVLPVNTDGFAIASGYLGLLSLVPNPFTSVAAIACGVVALHQIKRSGKHGKGRAVVGFALGGLSLAVFMLFVVAAALSPKS